MGRIQDYPLTSLFGGEDILVNQGGVTKRAPAGQAGGLATLDASGKLAQPRRIIDVRYKPGSTDAISTTAKVLNYVLPDPRITVHMDVGQIAAVVGNVNVYADAVHPFTIAAALVVSSDGGSTWARIGMYSIAGSNNDHRVPIPLVGTFTALSSGDYTFGISIGNVGGLSNTIYAHGGGYRGLLVMVAEV